MKTLLKIATVAAALIIGNSLPALAQDYPNKPIRIIIPLTPGSGADIAGRIIAKHLSEAWKQPVIVENRAGAGGQIGTQAVAKAEADGYTLLVQSASHAANPAIYKSLPYDPLKELTDVALLGITPYVMVTAKGGEYSTIKALVDAAKAKPGAIPFASAGVGSSTHLAAEYVAQITTILQSAEVREQFGKLGITPSPMKPDEFGRFVREQVETYRQIVKQADIQPQ